jgi:hypothetical protein
LRLVDTNFVNPYLYAYTVHRIVLDRPRLYVSGPIGNLRPVLPPREAGMTKKPRTTKHGRVKKIIKSPDPSVPEKAEVEVHEADELYKEIRIENVLEDEHGKKVKLKEDADVDVVVEAEPKATTPDTNKKP